MTILSVSIEAGRFTFDVFKEWVVSGMCEGWALFLGRLALVPSNDETSDEVGTQPAERRMLYAELVLVYNI